MENFFKYASGRAHKWSHYLLFAEKLFLGLKPTNSEVEILYFFFIPPYYLTVPNLHTSIKLDRVLTFCQHLESPRKKLTTHIRLLRQLAGLTWGTGTTTLHTATLALVHFAAGNWSPVWCYSGHTQLINKPINDTLHIVTGCLYPTAMDNLFVLAVILPTKLHCKQAMLSLAH